MCRRLAALAGNLLRLIWQHERFPRINSVPWPPEICADYSNRHRSAWLRSVDWVDTSDRSAQADRRVSQLGDSSPKRIFSKRGRYSTRTGSGSAPAERSAISHSFRKQSESDVGLRCGDAFVSRGQ